jgi:transposase
MPTRRRTWAPQGQTPIIRYTYKHDRISALATLTVSAYRQHMGLYMRCQPDNFTAVPVADFLRALLRQLRGHVILRWDQGSIHRGPAIAAVQQAYPRVPLAEFPAYAPALNPVEQLWNDFTGHTANSLPRHKRDLRRSLPSNTRRVRRSQEKLRSFMRASALPSLP